MADRSRLPDKDELIKLFDKLLGPDEELDEVTAEAVLKLHGVTPEEAVADVRERLEQEVQELRAKGADVPPALLEVLASLQTSQEDDSENINIDADTWVDDLLAGRRPGNVTGSSRPTGLHAFRGLNMENLSEEDRQILERVDAELEAEDEEGEG